MNLVQLTQHIKQMHDAFQGYAAKTVNVGLTVYSQFLGTLSQRLEAMTIQYTQLYKSNKRLISSNLNRYSKYHQEGKLRIAIRCVQAGRQCGGTA